MKYLKFEISKVYIIRIHFRASDHFLSRLHIYYIFTVEPSKLWKRKTTVRLKFNKHGTHQVCTVQCASVILTKLIVQVTGKTIYFVTPSNKHNIA